MNLYEVQLALVTWYSVSEVILTLKGFQFPPPSSSVSNSCLVPSDSLHTVSLVSSAPRKQYNNH